MRFFQYYECILYLDFTVGNEILKNVANLIDAQQNSVIANIFPSLIGKFNTQINLVITNKNGLSRAVRYNRVSLFFQGRAKNFRERGQEPTFFLKKNPTKIYFFP